MWPHSLLPYGQSRCRLRGCRQTATGLPAGFFLVFGRLRCLEARLALADDLLAGALLRGVSLRGEQRFGGWRDWHLRSGQSRGGSSQQQGEKEGFHQDRI